MATKSIQAKVKPKRLSRTRKPDELSLEEWQVELRRQFGRDQKFELENIGDHPFFSEFQVTNPESNSQYRVAIRGREPGENYCACADFRTNNLGTCKHVEFVLAKLARKRGGKTALAQGFQPPYSEIFVQYGARRDVLFRPGEDCPSELASLAGRYFDDDGSLIPSAYARFENFLRDAGKIEHELRCYEDVLTLVAEIRDNENRRERIRKAFPSGVRSKSFRDLLKVPLYKYQREGALFAAQAGRSLIGDEMGLGKTIQALAAAEIMARQLGIERVLIICPTSLKHQWEREISRFTERDAKVISGPQHQRRAQFWEDAFYFITNYDTVYRDLPFINAMSADLVILDEAQRIKNWETRTARCVKQIESPYCVVLTGTPLENRLEELVSIVQFVDQHRLGPTFRFLHEHQVRDENARVVGYKNLDEIGKTLEPILMRRRKDEVLDELPERLDTNIFVPMTKQQQEIHEENREMVARIAHKWRNYGFLTEADQRRLMVGLQYMRMSCDSTYLIDQQTDHGAKSDELATLLSEMLEDLNTKVVIFSQWKRMHEVLLNRLGEKRWRHVFFHGGVPSRKRKNLLDQFREDNDCRLFLATDAGGVGLNLQHANVVVNVDLPWNPAVLEQRIGRVHRLGQTRPVQVVNFVAQGTIEEGMLNVLAFKKSLFAGVLDGGEKEVFLGGSRLKQFIETVENVTENIPDRDEPSSDADVFESATSSKSDSGERSSQKRSTEQQRQPSGREDAVAEPAATTGPDPLTGLVENGLALLEQLAVSARGADSPSNGKRQQLTLPFQTEVDDRTGQTFVKLPMPDPEVLDRTLQGIATFLESIRSRSS